MGLWNHPVLRPTTSFVHGCPLIMASWFSLGVESIHASSDPPPPSQYSVPSSHLISRCIPQPDSPSQIFSLPYGLRDPPQNQGFQGCPIAFGIKLHLQVPRKASEKPVLPPSLLSHFHPSKPSELPSLLSPAISHFPQTSHILLTWFVSLYPSGALLSHTSSKCQVSGGSVGLNSSKELDIDRHAPAGQVAYSIPHRTLHLPPHSTLHVTSVELTFPSSSLQALEGRLHVSSSPLAPQHLGQSRAHGRCQ